MVKIGSRLSELRQKENMTMKAVAAKLDISYTTYIHYEKDENEPNNETLVKIAMLYGVSADYLLGISSKPAQFIEHSSNVLLDSNKKRIVELFDKLTAEQQSNIIGRAELMVEQNHEAQLQEGKISG